MPNGADVPGGSGFLPLAISLGTFIGSFFGGGTTGLRATQTPEVAFERTTEAQRLRQRERERLARLGIVLPVLAFERVSPAEQFGVGPPIPTPAEGGPPLVTERFADLPGPFVAPAPLPILQELGIPFQDPEPIFVPPTPFVAEPAPVPDVPELEEDMAADVPLLAGFLPAIRGALPQVAGPTAGALTGGLISDVLSGLFARAPQEMGLGQVPVRRGAVAVAERPSTRILRAIQASTGVRVKLSSAKALIRQLGLQNGARCLGISISDACTLIITPSPRRRRGISGSDIRIVKRTARRFQALQEDLSGLVSRRRAAPRRRVTHVKTAAIAHT